MYKKTKLQMICDAVCGVIMLLSILTYLLIGVFTNIWHPTWVILPCAVVACGLIAIFVNTYVNINKSKMEEVSESKDIKKSTK